MVLRTVDGDDRDVDVLGRVRNEPAFRRTLGFDTPWPRSRVESFVEATADDETSFNLLVGLADDEAASESPLGGADDPSRDTGDGSGDDPGTVPVGAVNLFDVDRVSGTLSYWLDEDHRGDGYATEAVSLLVDHAVDAVGLHRVEAEAFAENEPSQRLLDRLGFVHEGTARECRIADGEYRDVERFAVLADEWRGASGTDT